MTDLLFLPWARVGAAAVLNATAVAQSANRPALAVDVTATSTPVGAGAVTSTSVPLSFRMLGPGDVVGINPAQVIRTEPADGATDVETEVFACVEFDDPTLPWLFTPAVENAQHQLRPWLCLVVVRIQPGVTLDRVAHTLTIAPPADPAAELPNPAEAWAWAHVQVAGGVSGGASAAAVTAALPLHPTASLARLLSPRQLQPHTRYLACVVPTYAAGVQAGLGGAPGADDPVADAWVFGASAPVVLPVYFSFAFATGSGGDFLSLAQAVAHPPGVSAAGPDGLGARTLDLTRSGLSWPSASGEPAPPSLPLAGVLQPADALPAPACPAPVQAGLQNALLLASSGAPQLRPPVYGAAQAGVRRADLAGPALPPVWLTELNYDPRLRVMAGLGAQVVAAEQEDLVAAAWQQVEQAREVNALLARAQLARATSRRQVDKHLAGGAVGLLQLTSPQAKRMQLPPVSGSAAAPPLVGTPWDAVRRDRSDPALPATVSATYRRLARPRGPYARRTPAPAPATTAIAAQQVVAGLDAGYAVEDRVLAERLSVAAASLAGKRPDPLRELSVPISFPTSMVVPLVRLAPDALLAGAGQIPPNTALSLATNPTVLAAYMVGLNSEVTRELIWRGVPIDRRSTPFQWFWDVRGQAGVTQAAPAPDLATPIATWPATATLASRLGGAPTLVLAMRADLLRRYPRTAVYAVRAVPSSSTPGAHVLADETQPANVVEPLFTASLPPDLRVFGFGLAPADAIGSPGWFFVLQEQASETRFGCQQVTSDSYWSITQLRGPGQVTLPASPNAADVADAVRLPPVRCAIHARALLPAAGGT